MHDQQPDAKPPVTVVIPALNAGKTVLEQLLGLDAQEGVGAFSVIVVDNGSTDGTSEIARGFKARKFSLFVVSEPLRGVNRARNAGVAAAADGMVFLCDADDVVSEKWLEAMIQGLRPGTWVGGVQDFELLNTRRTRKIWNVNQPTSYTPRTPFVDDTRGCSCGFYRSMWQEVGHFDPSLSGHGDENEMFARAAEVGYEFRWVPDGVVHYRLRPGFRMMLRQHFRQGKSQIRTQCSTGGRRLHRQSSTSESVHAVAKLVLVSPKYLIHRGIRYEWAASLALQVGRLAGLRRARSIAD